MIRILIVEDSQVVAMLLRAILDDEPDMQVIGHASNGQEALPLLDTLQPDLITMDIRMPVMDGFEATRRIMHTYPVPIVVVSSSVHDEELRIVFRAIEEGALAVIEKPRGFGHPDFDKIRKELVGLIRAMAEVKVVRRRILSPHLAMPATTPSAPGQMGHCELLAIGCSTGGPPALKDILSALPLDFPLPIVIVQHISKGFIGGLVSWLADNVSLKVKLAEEGMPLLPSTVYFGPDDYHMMIERGSAGLVARLSELPPVNGFRPSVTPLFESVAAGCHNQAVGLIMTGMGADGAEGLLAMRRAGAHTLAQDEESAVIYGMPAAALALNAVDEVVALTGLPDYLCNLVHDYGKRV